MRLEGSLRHKVSAFIIISFIAIIIISFYAKSIIKPKIGWTPVTNILRELILDHKQQPGEYEVTYLTVQWIHNGVVLGFLMYLLYSKHSHIIFAFPNLFFKNEKPFGLIEKVDLRSENINCFGVQHISDFKKKDLIELFACTECGWCQESCPAYTTGNPLSPKKVILNLKDHLLKEGPDMLKNLKQKSHTALNNIIKEEVLWSCTTCGACEEACPVGIMPMSKIIEMRQACILMEGKFPEAVQIALRNIETQSNPWGLPQELRGRWAQDLGVKTLSENADVEYLFYVGCAGSYDERYISASKALVKLLQKAGIQFGILGNEEMCTGDSAKRIGNDYLAQELANANISIFNHYGVKKIITTCPHCFNTIKNEYHQHDGHYEVIHSTTLLSSLIKNGKINLKNHSAEENKRITYHDSCYLGRYNNIMDEPRDIIKNIRKYELVELKRNLKNSFCCGAGGGRMWMADKDGTSINFARSREVLESNVKMVATACPFCKTMISDGMKKENKDKEIQILDIAEIVAEELAREK